MNKTDLKTRWGHYCDTDRLVDTTMRLLSKHNHRNTEHGVCKMLDTYFTNKRNLIDLFQTSEHYIGDMRIVFDVELERENSQYEVRYFCDSFLKEVGARKLLVSKVNEQGKQAKDYLGTGISKLSPKDLLKESITKQLTKVNENLAQFNEDDEYMPTVRKYNGFANLISYGFRENYTSTVGDYVISRAEQMTPPVKIPEGMKTSRAFNKACVEYGIDKAPNYNKLFAKYSDLVSGAKRKLKFFMSLNPLDYLTMSFGVNWSSCHSISSHGGWCSGTLSYMLDETSIITYVHSAIPTDIEEGKIYREMFHWENNLLIQSRIYPQGNDGATDLYKTFRGFVQKEMAAMLNESNAWVKKSERCSTFTQTTGTHYADYNSNGSCNASYIKARVPESNAVVHIGHNRICPHCGREMEYGDASTSSLTHYDCILDEDAASWLDE